MRFLNTFQLYDFFDTLVSLFTAFVLGTLIGAERQFRQRSAGLRTNVLVAVGAAAFVDLGNRLTGADGAVRIIAYVVSGIGFLGAGIIFREGMQVTGLNTAATLWCSAAIGLLAGSGHPLHASVAAAFVILVNLLLRPIVRLINRQPIAQAETDFRYRVRIVCRPCAKRYGSGAGDWAAQPRAHSFGRGLER